MSEAAQSLEVGDYYIATLPLSDVSPHPDNPRIHTREQIDRLKAFISDVGVIKVSMGIQESRKRLYAGHAFHQALTELDYESEKFVVKDMTDAETLIAMVGDNRIGDLSKDNPVMLKSIAVNLVKMDVDVRRMQYTMKEINAMQPRREVVEDDPPEVEERVITQMGDLWHLGKHRVLCGDSTKAEAVERVMGGEKADMVFTDPPYGVEYDGGVGSERPSYGDTVGDYEPLISKAIELAKNHSKEPAPLFMFYASKRTRCVLNVLDAIGYELREIVIWNKPNAHYGALSAQYKIRYEPFVYAFQKGKAPSWHGDTTQRNLVDIDQPSVNADHPTMKPVSLFGIFIPNHTGVGDAVFDPFLGSGTTLIAADQLDRVCFGLEISPKYCDVIVRRYINHSRFDAAGVSVERNGKTLSWEQAERKAKLPKVI